MKNALSSASRKKNAVHTFLMGLVLVPVHVYRYCISPLMPAYCRFFPTCSGYVLEAVRVHGVCKGMLLGVRRLLRCHPFCKGGYDPVPPKPTYFIRKG